MLGIAKFKFVNRKPLKINSSITPFRKVVADRKNINSLKFKV